ncbi:FecR domain-containing protein [Arcobacter lanthieri]|uniref:FecR family protein n=1 Tax=Arcobacteraceae TaxID=2808963 RepID=UPI000DEA20ED|nr:MULTISPECIES: FecR domain-containing protein [Arcobacteraceae]MBL3519561.1 FecR domain-containing protein [Aliarcobacter lanthieri]RBQ27024.1 siderophore-interacting protein [Arcobacter sp. CECT 9188]
MKLNEVEQQANFYLIRQKEGLSVDEQKEFDIWIKDEINQKVYTENKIFIEDILNLDEDFIKELEDEILEDEKSKSTFSFKYLAASVVFLCMVTFVGYEVNRNFIPKFSKSFASIDEKILNIELPDNSIIDLDKNSQIQISYYDTKRVIDLEDGNAMFSVSRDENRPFLIKTKDTLIEVLGTKFEVINYDNNTIINVLEGVVQVSYVSNFFKTQTLAKLEKSQSFTFNNEEKRFIKNDVNIKEIASWKNDEIYFNKTSLKDASFMFERYSNNKMIFEDEKSSQLKISGKFSTLHYDSFLKSIEMIYPVKIKKDGNTVRVVGK